MKSTLLFCALFSSAAFAINSQSYFKDSITAYKADFEGRTKFLISNNNLIKKDISSIEYFNIAAKDFQAKIDYVLIPSQIKKNLVIIQSGTHGIEGLTGAGIQNFLLEYLHDKRYAYTSFLYIHLINPWGTFYNRRTNPNNVDLNRNFVVTESDFEQKNDDYAKINSFLNPEQPYEHGMFKKLSFYVESVKLILSHSIDTLRRSILKGQYTHPKGIYYGGNQLQPEFIALKKIWDREVQGYQKVVYIDLHTGYGEKGKLHLLSGHSSSDSAKKISDMYAPTTVDFGNNKNFYETSGDILTYFQETHKKSADIYPVTFEFGTLDSQTILGSLDSLYRMVVENQTYQHKADSTESENYSKRMFKEMFYPSDFNWRDKVLDQTKKEIDKVVRKLEDQ
tara:strand:+ start:37316 stop:38497 length:1182 start_codon:yes stop_codon:yes gene_type:complete